MLYSKIEELLKYVITITHCLKENESWKFYKDLGWYNLDLRLVEGMKPFKTNKNNAQILGR